jgi:peptidoglycan/xylan/chitin deacetylase (PgdA/CDA1 family)
MRALARRFGKDLLQASQSGGFLWRLPARFPYRVCLTFDDGPDPAFTPRILDLLSEHGVQGAFFLVGHNVDKNPGLADEIVRRGHRVGTHTYSHREITTLGEAELADELGRGREALRRATGHDSVLFRPPRGRVSWRAIRRVVRMGYVLVHWSKTYSDYEEDGLEALLARLRTEPVRGRDIVLLHDNNQHTVEALAALLPELRARGLDLRSCLKESGGFE